MKEKWLKINISYFKETFYFKERWNFRQKSKLSGNKREIYKPNLLLLKVHKNYQLKMENVDKGDIRIFY